MLKFSHALADAKAMLTYAGKFSDDSHPIQIQEFGRKKFTLLSSVWLFMKFFYEFAEIVLSMKIFGCWKTFEKEEEFIFETSPSFPLESLRQIKIQHPSINGITVVFTAIAEALKLHVKNLPTEIRIVTPIPMPGYDGSLTNHM